MIGFFPATSRAVLSLIARAIRLRVCLNRPKHLLDPNSNNNRALSPMFFLKIKLLLFVFFGPVYLFAQTAAFDASKSVGLPLFQNFSAADYGAQPGNPDLTQDQQGLLYFANEGGVLQFDGAKWQLIPLPNASGAYSIDFVEQSDLVYVGSNGDLGYLNPNEQGQLEFVSLLEKVPEDYRNFDYVWYTDHNGPHLYFVTDNCLLRWNLEQPEEMMKAWPLANIYHTFYVYKREVYLWQWDIGLQKVEGDALRLVPGGEAFQNSTIRFMTAFPKAPQEKTLVGTVQNGFFIYDGFKAEKFDLPTSLQNYFKEHTFYKGLQLPDGTFAFGTYGGGIVLTDQHFNIIQILNTDVGLSDDLVLRLFLDDEHQIWAALNNGIAKISWPSPYTLYSGELGLGGEIRGTIHYQGDFFSYGSNGLFKMKPSVEGDHRTSFVGVGQTSSLWFMDLMEVDQRLMGATTGEVTFLRTEQSDFFRDAYTLKYAETTFLKPSRLNKDLMYAGMGKNIGVLQKGAQGWVLTGQIDGGIMEYILSVEEIAPGQLWVTSTRHAYQLQIDELVTQPPWDSIRPQQDRILTAQTVKYDQSKAIPEGHSSVHFINDQLLFTTLNGFKSFNSSTGLFESNFSLPFQDTTRAVFSLNKQTNGDIWFFSSDENSTRIHRLIPTAGGSYEFKSFDFQHLLTEAPTLYKISADPSDPEIAWIATSSGLIKFNSKVKKEYNLPFPTLVRTVYINGDSLIYGGAPSGRKLPPLGYASNAMRFEYAATSFDQCQENSFQVWLEGFDKGWSEWTKEVKKDYTNLPEGDYVFRVRARNVNQYMGEEGTFSFTILPPWYRSWWAYVLYTLLAGLGIYGILRWRTHQLRKQKVELETLIKERTQTVESQKDRLEQQAEKLKELDQAKSRFFTNISHEFRTPLTIIKGMLDQIEKSPQKFLKKGLKMIKRNNTNLLNLVNQILDLRKLEVGNLQLHLIQADIIPHLNHIYHSFHSLAEAKEIKLHALGRSQPVLMDFDQEKVLRVFTNLFSNAIKFTPEGGAIYLMIGEPKVSSLNSSKRESLEITVRDTGIGIPKEKLPSIFDRFYQVDDSHTRAGEGTGIGLALSKELIYLMGGTIEVESEEGKGATFKVILPITRNAAIEQATAENQASDNKLLQPIVAPSVQASIEDQGPVIQADKQSSLLIIEDNPDVILYLESLLEGHFQLLMAQDGEEGINMALEHIPDLILSDVMMPKKDGFEVCSTLKKDVRTSHIPIVLLTAKADVEAKVEGLERGADAYLTKPFNEQELFIRLTKLNELRQQLRERYQTPSVLSKKAPSSTEYLYKQEDAFMQRLKSMVEEHLDDPNFGTSQLCKAMAISRVQLHRKVKALTDKSTSNIIRSIRLQKAKELLEQGEFNVSQVVYEVGFNHLSYFSKKFTEEFGVNPNEVRK